MRIKVALPGSPELVSAKHSRNTGAHSRFLMVALRGFVLAGRMSDKKDEERNKDERL